MCSSFPPGSSPPSSANHSPPEEGPAQQKVKTPHPRLVLIQVDFENLLAVLWQTHRGVSCVVFESELSSDPVYGPVGNCR